LAEVHVILSGRPFHIPILGSSPILAAVFSVDGTPEVRTTRAQNAVLAPGA
jgi:hypothetical protein